MRFNDVVRACVLIAALMAFATGPAHGQGRGGSADKQEEYFEVWLDGKKYSEAKSKGEADKVAESLKVLKKPVAVKGPLKKPAKQSTPDDEALKRGLEKVNKMITWGRRLGYTQASANLENWRDAKGDRQMPASAFQSEKFFLEHLEDAHRSRFIAGAERRIRDGTVKPGQTFDMEWTDSVNAPLNSDLWFALGGFTVISKVKARVDANPDGTLTLKFLEWKTSIKDVYDWDPGKSALVPGVGRITDDEMLALEKAGYGKKFNVTSDVMDIKTPAVVGDAPVRK
jgi:hypothetical protein